jgi:hypothetical protein
MILGDLRIAHNRHRDDYESPKIKVDATATDMEKSSFRGQYPAIIGRRPYAPRTIHAQRHGVARVIGSRLRGN